MVFQNEEDEMSAGANLLVDYYDAKPDARIRLIFRNYVNFEYLLDLYGKAISSKIIAAKNGRHRNTAEELGVRIQTSFIGDMTCETAVSNVSIEADIMAGNYHRGLLEDMDEEDSLMFSRELVTLQVMRDEFELVSTEVERLKPSEKKVFIPYIMKEKTIQEIADDRNIEYDSVRKSLKRIKKRIRRCVVPFLREEI